MNSITIYLGAFGLFGLGSLLIRNTSPYSRLSSTEYARRRKRKILGEMLLIVGALLLGLAMLAQFVSSFS
jgi:hypothetical protein